MIPSDFVRKSVIPVYAPVSKAIQMVSGAGSRNIKISLSSTGSHLQVTIERELKS